MGQYHALAIKTDGTLWGWGYNPYGQVGDGTTTTRSSPVQIGALTNWVDAAAGAFHSLGTNSDQKLYSWGYNGFGQLGDGTTTSAASTPTQVGALTTWTVVPQMAFSDSSVVIQI